MKEVLEWIIPIIWSIYKMHWLLLFNHYWKKFSKKEYKIKCRASISGLVLSMSFIEWDSILFYNSYLCPCESVSFEWTNSLLTLVIIRITTCWSCFLCTKSSSIFAVGFKSSHLTCCSTASAIVFFSADGNCPKVVVGSFNWFLNE